MKFAVLIVGICFLVYLLYFSRLEKSSISIGPFSFSFLHDQGEERLNRAIQYIEGYEIDPNKSKSVLVSLEQMYFQETANKSVRTQAFDMVLSLVNHESRKHQLRRLFASLYARKMGKLAAAEAEIRSNLKEKTSYTDLIFLGEILSLRHPDDNEEILKQYRKATSMRECMRDGANYQNALSNIYLREGHLLFNQGKFAEASHKYLSVIDINPRSYAGYNSLGNSYTNMGKLQEAVDCYDKAITYSTSDSDASLSMFLKATVLYHVIEMPGRLNSDKRASALKEAMTSADLSVQLVEREHGEYPLGSFQRHSLADKFLLRGRLYHALGDFERARNDFGSCLKNTFDSELRKTCQKSISELR